MVRRTCPVERTNNAAGNPAIRMAHTTQAASVQPRSLLRVVIWTYSASRGAGGEGSLTDPWRYYSRNHPVYGQGAGHSYLGQFDRAAMRCVFAMALQCLKSIAARFRRRREDPSSACRCKRRNGSVVMRGALRAPANACRGRCYARNVPWPFEPGRPRGPSWPNSTLIA